MTAEEKELSIQRMKDDGRDAHGKWNLDVIRQILVSWQFYAFVVAWACVYTPVFQFARMLTIT